MSGITADCQSHVQTPEGRQSFVLPVNRLFEVFTTIIRKFLFIEEKPEAKGQGRIHIFTKNKLENRCNDYQKIFTSYVNKS